jgi:hypothetical protein
MATRQDQHQVEETTIDMRGKVDEVCENIIVELVRQDAHLSDFDLSVEDVLTSTYGKSWRRGIGEKIKNARNKVIEDVREGEVNPKEESEYPFRFICNSIVIYALEQVASESSYFDDIKDVRSQKLHVALNKQLTAYHQKREDSLS